MISARRKAELADELQAELDTVDRLEVQAKEDSHDRRKEILLHRQKVKSRGTRTCRRGSRASFLRSCAAKHESTLLFWDLVSDEECAPLSAAGSVSATPPSEGGKVRRSGVCIRIRRPGGNSLKC